jgi:cytoskeleton protein RodZ
MEALGKYLSDARQKLHITVAQIAKDTNIAKKYLDALESEDYSIFPSETYLKGFLKSYAEYLKLDSKEVLRIYETIKIAESPTPIEKLLPKRKINFRPIISVAGLSAAFIIVIVVIVFSVKGLGDLAKNSGSNEKKVKKGSNTYVYKKDDPEMMLNLKKDDIIEFVNNGEKNKIKIKELTPVVKLLTNESANSEVILIKSFPVKIDLNNDKTFELVCYLNQWDNEKANITISSKNITAETQVAENTTSLQGSNAEVIGKNTQKNKIDFSVDIAAPALFRYKADNNQEIEKYYSENSKNAISANDNVVLWSSNAGNITLNFHTFNKTVKLGDAGEIVIKLLKWKQNSSGEYELEISNLN